MRDMTSKGNFATCAVLLGLLLFVCGDRAPIHADAAPVVAANPHEADYQAALPLYAEPSSPLSAVETPSKTDSAYKEIDLTYAGHGDDRVPAILVEPASASSSAPVPCLLLVHGLGGDKQSMVVFGQFFASVGYASLMIDLPDSGDRKPAAFVQPEFSDSDGFARKLVTMDAGAVVDLRRGIDYLGTRSEINSRSVGVIGLSMGAILGTILAGVDQRVKAVIAVSAGGDLGSVLVYEAKEHASLGGTYSSILAPADPIKLSRELVAADPLTFVAHISPRPFLMEEGKQDTVIPPGNAQKLFDAASDPKQIDWYPDQGHIPDPMVIYSAVMTFLQKYIPTSG